MTDFDPERMGRYIRFRFEVQKGEGMTPTPETLTSESLRAQIPSYAQDWNDQTVDVPVRLLRSAAEVMERMEARVEELDRVRSLAQAFVDAPTKFGIRHQAYMQLRKALDAARLPDGS